MRPWRANASTEAKSMIATVAALSLPVRAANFVVSWEDERMSSMAAAA